jgi:phage terminase large subunit GpA-like protein
MHTWQNTTLGEPVESEQGEGVEPHALLSRAEAYEASVPGGACFLTMGVDTQDDRLEALVVGWGPGEESWLVDRQRLEGDTTQPGPWAALDELLARQYLHANGRRMPISATCLDTAGHRTTQAYDYVLKHRQAALRKIFATIGRNGQRPIVSSPSPRTWGKGSRPVDLYTIGVDAAKSLIQTRLGLVAPEAERPGGPGFVHLPDQDWVDDEFAAQLTSERLMTKYTKGIAVQVWKQIRPRNEMLDCAVLALAALRLSRVDLTLLAERMSKPQPVAAPQPVKPAKPPWIERGRGGWLKGR